MPVRRRRTTTRKKRAPTRRRTTRSVPATGRRRAPKKTVRRRKAKSRVLGGLTGDLKKHAIGYLNPFYQNGVKIPDGGATESHALTHRDTFEISENSYAEDVIHILMYPGLQSGLYWSATNVSAPDKYVEYATDSSFSAATENAQLGYVETVGGINKWRVVSQGLRLSLLNTFEQNDGWWEACRVPYKLDCDDWQLVGGPASGSGGAFTATEGLVMRPKSQILEDLFIKNLAENKSYQLGALKDIHNHQFDLMPYSGLNDFHTNELRYNMDNGSFTGDLNGSTLTMQLKKGYDSCKDVINAAYDNDHDMVYIRIRPGNNPIKLLADMSVNHEVVYDIDTEYAKFMTPNAQMDKKMLEAIQKHKQALGHKASRPK
jgi:hypothetical protein